MKEYINGKLVEMTSAQITQYNEEAKANETRFAEIKTARETRDKLKASAKTKLMAGEALTEEEADQLLTNELVGGNE
tara:strand:- start:1042 stop:1272 length:231 start_codon:yes stop_codon:yes gene_type:complete